MSSRVRPRITVTIDPDMLAEIDIYIQEHEGLDRSQVIDEALRDWYARMLDGALQRQSAAPGSPEEPSERGD